MGNYELTTIQPIDYNGWLRRIDDEKGKLIKWQDADNKVSASLLMSASLGTIISLISGMLGTWSAPSLGSVLCMISGGISFVAWLVFLGLFMSGCNHPFDFTLRSREERAAKRSFRERRREFKSLRRRVSSFNRTLLAYQKAAGFLDTGDVGIRQAAVSEWKAQREALVNEMYDWVKKLKSPDERRALEARRQKFVEAAAALKELIGALGNYREGGSFEKTRDVSQYLGAMAMRDRLEAERDALGLPANALPPPLLLVQPKLPAKTT